MRQLNHITLLTCGLATALATLALGATAQVPVNMPSADKADEQAKRLAESPFRRILEAGRVEVKLRRESEAAAPAAAAHRRVTAAPPAAPKPQTTRPAPAEAPAPASSLALAPASTTVTVPPAAPLVTERLWAAFNGATASVEGGSLEGTVYAEKPGDAALGDISVRSNGVLNVTGQFSTQGGSNWAGVGIVLIAQRPVVATTYRALKIHLAGVTTSKLRVRLLGDDPAISQKGCYPVVVLSVKPQVAEYRVEFSQFAAPEYCGADGADVKSTLESLTAIEVIDAAEPVRDRMVSFNVGTLSLLK